MIDVPISTWKFHKCDVKHKTAAVFMKCALRKYDQNSDGNWTLPSTSTSGRGNWAVVEQQYSGDYYTEHNGKRRNHGHIINNVHLFGTAEQAAKLYTELEDRFNSPSGHQRGLGPLPAIIKVEL